MQGSLTLRCATRRMLEEVDHDVDTSGRSHSRYRFLESQMSAGIALVFLFGVATVVALAARRLKLPYTVALVVAGLALGSAHAFEPPHLTKDLLYTVFLPGLLFEAAFHLEFRSFWRNKITIVALAIPALMLAIALTAGVLVPLLNGLGLVEHYGVGEAVVFAALISATDPIAVVALFKSLGAPKRLAVIIEGESLLNDGTAVVVFTLVLAFVMGRPTSAPMALLDFVRVVGMGVFVGGALGYLTSLVIHMIDDPMIEITLTTIAAYGSFIAAEHFHFSGVIATVTAGMIAGNHAARTGMSASTRVAVAAFWEYLAFALNSLIFLLIGFEVHLSVLAAAWRPILLAYVVVTVGRAIVIVLVTFVLRRTKERTPPAWSGVLAWGGLRGALSMVLVLALPLEFPHRELIISMTFGVVILSILVQGLTMAPLLKLAGLLHADADRLEYERLLADGKASRAALLELDRLELEHSAAPELLGDLRASYQARVRSIETSVSDLRSNTRKLLGEEKTAAVRRLLVAEKDALLRAHRLGELGTENYDALASDVDARLVELDGEHTEDDASHP